MPLELSRGEIITEGLSQAGRPDLLSNGRLWLNIFLERMYMNQDWDWLIKTLDDQPIVQGGDLPRDYRASRSATIKRGTSSVRLEVIESDEYDERKDLLNTTGGPTFVYINRDLKTMNFLPLPDTSNTWSLKYYYMPDIPSHTIPENDSLIPKWDAPSVILVNHIFEQAMQYNDDQRQQSAPQVTDASIAEAKMNNMDKRAGKNQLKLGKSFKGRFGRRGNGGPFYGNQ